MLKLNRQLPETNIAFDLPDVREGLREIYGRETTDEFWREFDSVPLDQGIGPDLTEEQQKEYIEKNAELGQERFID